METAVLHKKKTLAPKLRFKDFKESWEMNPLIELSVIGFSNGAFNDPKKVGSGYRIINVKDMYIDGTIKVDTLTRVAIDEKEFLKNRVEYGDIFFTRSSLVKEGIAYSNVNLNEVDDLTFDGHLIRMRPNKKLHSPVFLYYNFSTKTARKQFIKRGKTATMTTIGQEDISKVEIIFPKLPEQQKIASFLSAVDEKIQQLTRKKELLEQYKKGVMQQLFSGKLRFKDENGKAFPKWEEKRLDEVANFRRGSFPQPYGLAKWFDEINGLPFVQVYDVDDNMLLKPSTKTKISKLAAEQSVFVKEGTLVLTIQGSIGRIAKTQYDAYVDRTLLIFQSYKKPIDVDYFKHVVSLLFEIEKTKAPGGTIKTITKEALSSFKIMVPQIEEQKKIANYLSNIDIKIDIVNKQITQTQTFKKGLLQQMFV
jgi:type I restriction enzyme S subunit